MFSYSIDSTEETYFLIEIIFHETFKPIFEIPKDLFGVFGVPHDESLPVVGLARNIEDTPEVHWEHSDFLEKITSIRGDQRRLRQISRRIMDSTVGAGKMQLIQNMRSILQLFEVRVVVYNDKMEIQGHFPTQTLGVLHTRGRQLINQGVG